MTEMNLCPVLKASGVHAQTARVKLIAVNGGRAVWTDDDEIFFPLEKDPKGTRAQWRFYKECRNRGLRWYSFEDQDIPPMVDIGW